MMPGKIRGKKMIKVIDGKTYNTKTAKEIDHYSNGLGCRDFRNLNERLYITKKGNFFLKGEGGAMTKYSRPVGDMTDGGDGIIPLSKMEALEWMENYGAVQDFEAYFSDIIEDA